MLERYLTALRVDDAGQEDPAATRERLRDLFPRGATRRMTQLGMLVSSTLAPLEATAADTIIYASRYAETRALEAYLESFPTASPTLFQTSIHPSAVQQGLIGRQQAVTELFPVTGDQHLAAQALTVAMMSTSERVLFCGGEERGTWLLEQKAASDRTFAFAVVLSRSPAGALGRVTFTPAGESAEPFPLTRWFDALVRREALTVEGPAGQRIDLQWG